MAIQRTTDAEGATLIFVLTGDDPDGPVSVVGSFNDWTPGAHPLETAADGSRSVTVVVAAGEDVYFRYLASDGYWFDDPDADEITADGSVLRAQKDEISTELSHQATAVGDDASTASEPAATAAATAAATEPATHDETGERLEAVAERIDVAKSAARDLVDRDAIESSSTDSFDDQAARPTSA